MKYSVKINDKQYEVEVERMEAVSESAASISSHAAVAETTRPKPAASVKAEKPAAIASAPAGSEKITAPIPGTILDVKVRNGQKVKKGQLLFILEAMKMENEILAVRDGIVEALAVAKGTSVNTGDMLLALA